MDASDDVTDDLLGLPGFIRRNLLLMRELDTKFVSLLDDARKKEQVLLSKLQAQTPTSSPAAADKTASKREASTSPIKRQASDEKGSGPAKGRGSKQKQAAESKSKPAGGDTKRHCKGNTPAATESGSTPTAIAPTGPPPDSVTQEEMDDIQKTRMDAIYLMQEKLAINDQVTYMLKHEYENLKVLFDNMYHEMETSGQMTDKLRMSFTVTKSKPPQMDTILSGTEQELLGNAPGSAGGSADMTASRTPAWISVVPEAVASSIPTLGPKSESKDAT
ncbi:hypothetical protein, conserved [Babesia bigemina]|uniref:Inhibitor of growth protein N-terminal histone-binding domain-containing protein n=1 Tax=Babesia bigemina TaxID=5866 RepID=A0A061DA58_BABBI|nr:hypothetical protein, conserved [Babesia bigemina]CDR95784.1 hypothetical protein, conserved [Babesia bigemina]|eukprot:XP_012767970.1 hypothetical protein, conserved [Babesia bigemina]